MIDLVGIILSNQDIIFVLYMSAMSHAKMKPNFEFDWKITLLEL